MAGAPGFEPGIAGPKPAALPLGYAPRACGRSVYGTSVGEEEDERGDREQRDDADRERLDDREARSGRRARAAARRRRSSSPARSVSERLRARRVPPEARRAIAARATAAHQWSTSEEEEQALDRGDPERDAEAALAQPAARCATSRARSRACRTSRSTVPRWNRDPEPRRGADMPAPRASRVGAPVEERRRRPGPAPLTSARNAPSARSSLGERRGREVVRRQRARGRAAGATAASAVAQRAARSAKPSAPPRRRRRRRPRPSSACARRPAAAGARRSPAAGRAARAASRRRCRAAARRARKNGTSAPSAAASSCSAAARAAARAARSRAGARSPRRSCRRRGPAATGIRFSIRTRQPCGARERVERARGRSCPPRTRRRVVSARRLDADPVAEVDALEDRHDLVLAVVADRPDDEREVDLRRRGADHASASASATNSAGSSSSARTSRSRPIAAERGDRLLARGDAGERERVGERLAAVGERRLDDALDLRRGCRAGARERDERRLDVRLRAGTPRARPGGGRCAPSRAGRAPRRRRRPSSAAARRSGRRPRAAPSRTRARAAAARGSRRRAASRCCTAGSRRACRGGGSSGGDVEAKRVAPVDVGARDAA